MVTYRISKFDPQYRDKKGRFQKEDWTDISDINKVFDGQRLNYKEYLRVEKNYVDTIMQILFSFHVSNVSVKQLEKYTSVEESIITCNKYDVKLSLEDEFILKTVHDDMLASSADIPIIIRLILRGCMWCKLKDLEKKIVIEFGYDYYAYISCSVLSNVIIRQWKARGMFIERLQYNLSDE